MTRVLPFVTLVAAMAVAGAGCGVSPTQTTTLPTSSRETPASVATFGPVSTPTQRPTATTVGPTPTIGLEQSWAAPNLEISVDPTTLQIGETADVTVRAIGQGGLPEYYLNLDSNFLKVNTLNQLLYTTFDDIPHWTIEAVNIATTSLSVSMHYQTKICLNGDCYFNFVDTSSPSVVVTVAPTESATYTLQTSVEPFYSGGTVSLGPLPGPDGSYSAGTEVTLTASPSDRRACDSSPYWSFVGWSGAVEGSEPKVSITMDSDKTVTAGFSEFFPPNC